MRLTPIQRPGALHKARWMAKLIIYSLKLSLLETKIFDIPMGAITTKDQIPKLRDFVCFISLVYWKWWYKDAPQFAAIHANISKSVTNSLKRHLWYLVPEMVPLVLLSSNSKVYNDQKANIALKLLEVKAIIPVSKVSARLAQDMENPFFLIFQ